MDELPACLICGSNKITSSQKVCGSCGRLLKLFKEVESWDLKDETIPKILKLPLPNNYDKEKLRKAGIDAINKFISYRKGLKEAMENDDIYGIELEHLLDNILSRLSKVQDKKIHRKLFQIGNFFDSEFTKDQKVKLYRLFKSLFYEIPMEPLKIQIIHEYYGDKFHYKII